MDLSGVIWHSSSYSDGGSVSRVEVAVNLPGVIAVRDSNDPRGPVLTFTESEWTVFATAVRSGHYDER